MLVIGVDPGVNGAICSLRDGRLEALADMPAYKAGKRQEVNGAALAQIVDEIIGDERDLLAVVERVNAMPGGGRKMGAASAFSFGMSYGVVVGVLAYAKLPTKLVIPAAWKRASGLLGKDKEASRVLAQQLYPTADLRFKKHADRAEAILIARHGWLLHRQEIEKNVLTK